MNKTPPTIDGVIVKPLRKIARVLPSFRPQWNLQKGLVELYETFRNAVRAVRILKAGCSRGSSNLTISSRAGGSTAS